MFSKAQKFYEKNERDLYQIIWMLHTYDFLGIVRLNTFNYGFGLRFFNRRSQLNTWLV